MTQPTTPPTTAFPVPFNYFAAQAMAEMNWEDFDGSARDCYEIADAMLRAREAA